MGAFALILSSERPFRAIIPFVLMSAVLVLALGNRLARLDTRFIPTRIDGMLTHVLMFLSGVYGGNSGAGMGDLLIAVLSLAGFCSLHDSNAEKNLTATLINTTAVGPQLLSGLVHLPAAGAC